MFLLTEIAIIKHNLFDKWLCLMNIGCGAFPVSIVKGRLLAESTYTQLFGLTVRYWTAKLLFALWPPPSTCTVNVKIFKKIFSQQESYALPVKNRESSARNTITCRRGTSPHKRACGGMYMTHEDRQDRQISMTGICGGLGIPTRPVQIYLQTGHAGSGMIYMHLDCSGLPLSWPPTVGVFLSSKLCHQLVNHCQRVAFCRTTLGMKICHVRFA